MNYRPLIFPVICSALLTLLGILYYNQNDAIAKKASKESVQTLRKEVDGKVDNEVMIQMIEVQKIKLQMYDRQQKKQEAQNEKILDSLQEIKIDIERIKK